MTGSSPRATFKAEIFPLNGTFQRLPEFAGCLQMFLMSIVLGGPVERIDTLVRVPCVVLLAGGLPMPLRWLSLHRLYAVRLCLTEKDYHKVIRGRYVASRAEYLALFFSLQATAILSLVPLLHVRCTCGIIGRLFRWDCVESTAWFVGKEPVWGWIFAGLTIAISVFWLFKAFLRSEVEISFEMEVDKHDVPIKKLYSDAEKSQDGWCKIASTSRKHDIWIRKVHGRKQPGEEFEMSARIADSNTSDMSRSLRIILK